jgi:hypothetical protein
MRMTGLARLLSRGGAALALFAAVAFGVPAARAAPVTVTENVQLNFATVIVPSTGGTVQISSAGAVTGPAGFLFKGTPAAGQFTASGNKNAFVTITFSSSSTLTGPGTAMTINTFSHDAGASPRLNSSGTLVFKVGARLVVNAAQKGGTYTGTFTVTVA